MIRNFNNKNAENNLKKILRAIVFILSFVLSSSSIFGQVTGSPSSGQSASQLCAPAQYTISFGFEFYTPASPSSINKIVYTLKATDGTFIAQWNYFNIPVQIGVPWPYIAHISDPIDLPFSDCEYLVEIRFY